MKDKANRFGIAMTVLFFLALGFLAAYALDRLLHHPQETTRGGY